MQNRRGSPRGNGGGYRGFHQPKVPPQNQLYVDTGSGGGVFALPPLMNLNFDPNEAAESGMNGDGWQGPGGRGGSHHMNGGGGGGGNRRGGGGGGGGYSNQRMGGQQHHGNMNRMMPPAFRPQQQPYMPPYGPPMGGMPGDVLDLSMRMDGISMSSTPTGMPFDMGPPGMGPPQGGWNQPAPFAPPPVQDDLYGDPLAGGGGGYGAPPHHQPMAPYGQQQRGGNQYGGGGGNRNQGGGGRYQPRHNQGGGYVPPMMVQNQTQFYGGNHQQQGGQASFAPSPFSMSGSQTPLEHHMGHGGGSYGGSQAGGQMDDYSMWTDENDEEAKRKKTLRDKGLLAWGDADASNSKPIRRWIVPEGQEEDFDTAMERCPNHLKKRALNEEALRRRLASDNPAIVAQAQVQAEEEANATCKIGKRPIIACGWGDLPSELGGGGGGGDRGSSSNEKNDYDQGSSKGNWEDGLRHHQPPQHQPYHHSHHHQHNQHQQQQHDDGGSMWSNTLSGGNNGGGPSSGERNPFFAHHMQQQAQQQQHHYSSASSQVGGGGGGNIYGDNGVLLDSGSVWSSGIDGSPMGGPHHHQLPQAAMMGTTPNQSSSMMPPIGMSSSSVAAGYGGGGPPLVDISGRPELTASMKRAVASGYLDATLLTLPHMPSNVLDMLTEVLTVIPRLDTCEEVLTKLKALRPSNCDGEGTSGGGSATSGQQQQQQQKDDKEETSWMNKEQKLEHEKAVISVVTSKIEVTQLARKITEALIEAGLLPPSAAQTLTSSQFNYHGGPPGPPDGGPGGPPGGGDFQGNGGGAPDHFYDYSFLG